MGYVVEDDEEKEQILIHFDGWGDKYDEEIPYHSNRIGPFRMITYGYTGMKNNTKRENWKYSYDELELIKQEVEETISKEFDNFETAHQATQFLRGKLYIFVDSLLANTDEDQVNKEDARDMIDFMEKVFLLIIKWLELFPSKYMKYFELHKKNKKAFLVDKNVAIAAAGTELIDILNSSFGEAHRINRNTKKLSLTEEESETSWYFVKRKDIRFKVAL